MNVVTDFLIAHTWLTTPNWLGKINGMDTPRDRLVLVWEMDSATRRPQGRWVASTAAEPATRA